MVKQRMTALDVRATVEEMRANLIGLRLLNIYNISNKMFLFKFGHDKKKKTVLLENGIRFHITELSREKPKVPSQFTLKLRKHVRAWRLDSICQLQHDRTIDLCFGVASTEGCFHIIVELFSKGNIALTDYTYQVMMLLHTHRDNEGPNLTVHQVYPVTAPFLAAGGTNSTTTAAEEPHVFLYPPQVGTSGCLQIRRIPDADLTQAQQQLKAERTHLMRMDWELGLSRSNDRTVVQALVAGIRHFGPDLAQHVLTVTNVANTPQKSWSQSADEVFTALLPGLLEAFDLAKANLASAGGYLIKPKAKSGGRADAPAPPTPDVSAAAAAASVEDLVAVAEKYESFTPILLAQHRKEGVESLYRSSFGRVCDEYFLITETERIDASNEKRKSAVKGKAEKFAVDHARRIEGLEADIALNHQKGEQLILNADRVDEAIQLINGALATGISWDALRALLKRRHAEGHPVAYMIHDIFLERNSISVLLERPLREEEGDVEEDEREEDCDVPPMVVEVALSKTAHANAADYFGKRKQHLSKLERTVAATDKAAAGAARKGARTAVEKKERKVIVKERQRNWWEKFFWFRTTAGDLVLRGRDVQSTELLIRRVMCLGDIFVHCEVDGALPCLVRPLGNLWQGLCSRNTNGDATVSPATQPVAMHSLCEAGAWCVALSGAWESKQISGSWWVYASQVTGGTAAGTYLYTGERHLLLPQPMTLGCALLFYVSRTVNEPAAVAPAVSSTDTEMCDDVDGEEGEGERAVCEEVDAVDELVVLLRELPSFLPWPSESNPPSNGGESVVPADTATSLAELPSVEALRAEQRRQRSFYVAGGAAPCGGGRSGGFVKRQVKGKAAKKGGARNSRVDREGLEGTPAVKIAVVPSSEVEDSVPVSAVATSTERGSGAAKILTKHQKKKLRRFEDKYGGEDDEDGALVARLNGCQLSRQQLLRMQQRAEQHREEEKAKREEGKASRALQRAAGTLRYRTIDNDYVSESEGDEEEEEEVEEVSVFTDVDDIVEVQQSSVTIGEEAGDSNEEHKLAEAVSETGGDNNAGEETVCATTSAAAGSRDDREAAVVQDAAEVERVLPHYTMRPGPMDIVQHVVAVCAPMTVVGEYAYHAMLSMGNAKKGVLAAKLLEIFTARAEKGDLGVGAASVGTSATSFGVQGKKARKMALQRSSGGAPTGRPRSPSSASPPAAAVINPSLVKALQMASANDVVQQLRGNAKPSTFRL